MKNYTFNFEVQTVLEQFVSAFNDIIIKRYDNTKTVVPSPSGVKVNFVYSPKQRVINALTTPGPGGLTVPVVAINVSGLSRDNTRVFNKLEGFTIPNYDEDSKKHFDFLRKIPQPIPVNIGISMTIVTKYQSDMDQIINNFVPYCDPYIVISWKLPFSEYFEIRSEVLWNGKVSLSYPVSDLNASQPYRITAETGFVIKGWLFKKADEIVKKIYTIDEKLEALNFSYTNFDDFEFQNKIFTEYEYSPEYIDLIVKFETENQEDSDSDGFTDATEVLEQTDPNDSNSSPVSLFNVFNNI